MKYHPLPRTTLEISEIAFGAWPIAGMTTPGIIDAESLAAIRACFEAGINHLDTAYMYGACGESEKLIAQALGNRRGEMVIATKGGLHWGPDQEMVYDARPQTLRRECEESLRRLQTDRVELYYLHAPDPNTPVAESAGEIKRLMDEGKTLSAGASNMTVAELEEFARECPLAAYQPPYNMLQRQIEADTLPWCRAQGVAVLVYWPFLKGLLAGKMRRDRTFENDSRRKYPQYQGEELEKNLALIENLRAIAAETGHSVAQLVLRWTLQQPGVTCTLCGARRPDQVRENAGGSGWELTAEQLARIEKLLAARGAPAVRSL
ncbi:MAG: aldo/keto reductase [Pirellulales bacterium]|nr:aldo/keto reductase [Pirellulales bacterium]